MNVWLKREGHITAITTLRPGAYQSKGWFTRNDLLYGLSSTTNRIK